MSNLCPLAAARHQWRHDLAVRVGPPWPADTRPYRRPAGRCRL